MESSIDNPATPVLTARATLTATFSASWAKPPSKSALTGRSTAPHERGEMLQHVLEGDIVVGPSDRPGKAGTGRGHGLEAQICSARALPTSQGLGSAKHPVLCSLRKIGACPRLLPAWCSSFILAWQR